MVNLVSFNKLLNAYYRRRESVSCIPFFLPPFLPRSLRVYNYFSSLSFLHSRRFRSILYAYVYIRGCMCTTYCMQVLCADGFPLRKMMRVVRMICDVHEKVNLSIPFLLFFHACPVYTHGCLSPPLSLSLSLSPFLASIQNPSSLPLPSCFPISSSFLPPSFIPMVWICSNLFPDFIPDRLSFRSFSNDTGQFLTFTY